MVSGFKSRHFILRKQVTHRQINSSDPLGSGIRKEDSKRELRMAFRFSRARRARWGKPSFSRLLGNLWPGRKATCGCRARAALPTSPRAPGFCVPTRGQCQRPDPPQSRAAAKLKLRGIGAGNPRAEGVKEFAGRESQPWPRRTVDWEGKARSGAGEVVGAVVGVGAQMAPPRA